jgi:cell division protein FtsB
MPPARSTTATRAPRPVRVQSRFTVSKIRWDRKFRTLMLLVLALVLWLGLHAAMSLMHTRAQADRQLQQVSNLVSQNRKLEAQQKSLHQSGTIMRDARALGMVRDGERPFVVTGLPGSG